MSACSMKFFTWDLKVEIERILTNLNTKSSKCQRRGEISAESSVAGTVRAPHKPLEQGCVHRQQGKCCRN